MFKPVYNKAYRHGMNFCDSICYLLEVLFRCNRLEITVHNSPKNRQYTKYIKINSDL